MEDYLRAGRPEFILFQCGADSLEGDPLTHLRFTEEAHAHAAARLCAIADELGHGRVVGMGGGGYNRRNLARAWTRVVEAFVERQRAHACHFPYNAGLPNARLPCFPRI